MAAISFRGYDGQLSQMTPRFAEVNGINIAYSAQGKGPPLVLVMGYRLNSTAWPAALIAQLAQRFTVITLDNRGTGQSDKPVTGYAIANMARDVRGLLDELKFPQVHMLGYSMGGAIAQEFVRQFPDRMKGLILCATMAGGPGATYAEPHVVRVMRDLDGLTPEQAARRIWSVTYAPGYLGKHRTLAEEQMKREIALPTPLHAADLQFQAFAEFDCSQQLAAIKNPTLVLTGDLDQLISPQNSLKMAKLIPRARLTIVPGAGHRVMWEATDECVAHIAGFLDDVEAGRDVTNPMVLNGHVPPLHDTLASITQWFFGLPSTLTSAAFDSLTVARQSMLVGGSSRYGDGKPIVLVPPHLGSDLALLPLSAWLKALGYRPATVGPIVNFGDAPTDRALAKSIHDITARIGRKAVLVAHSTGYAAALRAAETVKDRVSDVVVFGVSARVMPSNGLRTHFFASGLPTPHAMLELPRLLRAIGIELLEP
jgi:pimeloyl-ACP methyl ester carboxylesterase